MSKSEQSIALIDTPDDYNIWLMELAHTWTNIEFVQEVLAQLPSIEAIVQQAVGQLPTSIETIVQQPVAQLPNIEDIRHSSRSLKIYSQVHSSFKQILGLSTQELIRKSSIHKNILL